jgi:colicin import membrane protein
MAAEAALRWRDDGDGFARAIVLAVGLHVLLALLFWALSILDLARETPAAAGQPVINADLNVSDAEAAAAREALEFTPEPLPEPEPVPEPVEDDTVPPPQPIPEPVPDEALVERQADAQERVPVPDEVQQEEVRDDAISDITREREQEEKRRQEQIDLTERERQREAEQRQRLAAQAEAEQKRLDREKRLAAIRAERARLQRQTEMSEQRLRQLADAQASRASSAAEAAARADAAASGSPPAGNNGAAADDGLRARYAAAIQAAVVSKWTRPDNLAPLPCRMTIRQLPGGEVMSVDISPSCPYDEAGKRSVEAAVLKAQPLPYAGFESVFERTLNFTFRPSI